ncbi:MAG: Brp/Blh family beta-carotene 15,15'-dioxygenase [Halalkalicoccus sp.]
MALTGPFDVAVERRLVRAVFPATWTVLDVLDVIAVRSLAGVGPTETNRYLLLASVLPFGLRALDYVAVSRARGVSPSIRSLLAVGALYLIVGGLYATVWFVASGVAFVSFLLLTWLHW